MFYELLVEVYLYFYVRNINLYNPGLNEYFHTLYLRWTVVRHENSFDSDWRKYSSLLQMDCLCCVICSWAAHSSSLLPHPWINIHSLTQFDSVRWLYLLRVCVVNSWYFVCVCLRISWCSRLCWGWKIRLNLWISTPESSAWRECWWASDENRFQQTEVGSSGGWIKEEITNHRNDVTYKLYTWRNPIKLKLKKHFLKQFITFFITFCDLFLNWKLFWAVFSLLCNILQATAKIWLPLHAFLSLLLGLRGQERDSCRCEGKNSLDFL